MKILLIRLIQREGLIILRKLSQITNAWVFFLLVFTLFPLCLNPEPQLLKHLSPAIFWLSLLMAMLLSAERMFTQDFTNGMLEQWLLYAHSLNQVVLTKIIAHWLFCLLPLILLMPVLALFLHLSLYQTWILVASVCLATPTMLLVIALANAFTLNCGNRGLLMALLVFPILVPVMIFGSGALQAALIHQNAMPLLAILGALSLLALSFLPAAVSAALQISLDN